MSIVQAFVSDVRLVEDDDGFRIGRENRTLRIASPASDERRLWQLFATGAPRQQIDHTLAKLPADRRPMVAAMLHTLIRSGWIVDRLQPDGEPPIATRTVISDWYQAVRPNPDQGYVLSRFACARSHPDGLLIESPRCHARVVLHADAAVACLAGFVRGVASGWHSGPEPGASLIPMLVEAGLLVPRQPDGATPESADPVLRQWELHDLLFHTRSRSGRHRDPYGRVERFRGSIPEPQAVRQPVSDDIRPLPRPSADAIVQTDPPFSVVMERRRSIRESPATPLTLNILSEFLFRSARIEHLDVEPPTGSHRPFASAGGLNELELYLAVHHCDDLDPGLYRYDPIEHRLERLPTTPEALERLSRYCGVAPIGVHVSIAARFQRVSWRYASLAYSLILRDAGCLLQTMYLVATAMNRGPCAIGAGDADLFARLTGLPYEVEGSVADFVLR